MADDPIVEALVARGGAERRVRERALRDGEFRAALLADPRAAIASLLGVDLAGIDFRVVEEGHGEVVVVIPSAHGAQMQDAELAQVAAAGSFMGMFAVSVCTNSCGKDCAVVT